MRELLVRTLYLASIVMAAITVLRTCLRVYRERRPDFYQRMWSKDRLSSED